MKVSICFALFVFASACGGSDTSDVGSLRLEPDPAAVTVAGGGTATVIVHLVRQGSLDGSNVMLAAGGGPPGLTAAFDTDSTTADTATLTVTAVAGIVSSEFNLQLVGTTEGHPTHGPSLAKIDVTVAGVPPPVTGD